ncbi:lipoprotein and hemagglutinin (VlhA) family protein [Mycoplasmoides gallisepticum]|nr:lipoprotein and hemagglutinin (VlhA) family protein [Mycoplasmoides gallisepticum]
MSTTNGNSVKDMKKTLTLKKGLNKITLAGGTLQSNNAPYIGDLSFTLRNSVSNTDSSTNAVEMPK